MPAVDAPLDEHAEALLATILETPVESPTRPRRRWGWSAVGILVALGLAGTTYAVLRSQQVSTALGVQCFAEATFDSNSAVVPYETDPVAACIAAWQRGDIDGVNPERLEPTYTACVRESNVAVVFPGGDRLCERLGIPAFDPADPLSDDPVALLQDLLVKENQNGVCRNQADGVARGAEILAEAKNKWPELANWTSGLAEPFPEDRECAGYGLVDFEQRVLIFGLPQEWIIEAAK